MILVTIFSIGIFFLLPHGAINMYRYWAGGNPLHLLAAAAACGGCVPLLWHIVGHFAACTWGG